MLDHIAKAIEIAQANAPFYVMPRFKNKYDVFEILPPGHADVCHLVLASQDEAENLCEKLNGLYVARKVVESMREATDAMRQEYFKIKIAEGNTHHRSTFVDGSWECSIDAILKSKP